jgi:hypothetical protein
MEGWTAAQGSTVNAPTLFERVAVENAAFGTLDCRLGAPRVGSGGTGRTSGLKRLARNHASRILSGLNSL